MTLLNSCFELCYKPTYFPGLGSAEAHCDELWRRLSDQYKHRGTPCQLSNLALAFFTSPAMPHRQFPCLATRMKAAETRHPTPRHG